MENLDIEKLERKNIYRIPDDIFENVQANVLREIAPKKHAKIIKLNWIYSAAAAIALIFGVSFLFNNDKMENNNSEIVQNVPIKEKAIASGRLSDDKIVNNIQNNDENSDLNLSVITTKFEKPETNQIDAIAQQKKSSKPISPQKIQVKEIPMDQIISSFTSADLADLSRNAEQDVYLDLYN